MNYKYFMKKIVQSLITIMIVLTLTFILFRVMPGDPTAMFVKSGIDPSVAEKVKEDYGLNLPIYQQYFVYLKNIFRGDFGDSFSFRKPVMKVIGDRLPNTIILALCAQTLAIGFGIIFGMMAAANRGKKIDVGLLGFSLFIYAIPAFWFGMVLIVIFGVKLDLVPLFGMMTPGLRNVTKLVYIKDIAKHLILPVLTLGLAIFGSYVMIMRSSLLDVFTEDYINTARAKGFDRRYIIRKHALPNAMLPMVTVIATSIGFIVSGAIQTETVFTWPGIGTLMLKALVARDYPLLQGSFIITSFAVVTANFLADIVYMYIDPRIKYE